MTIQLCAVSQAMIRFASRDVFACEIVCRQSRQIVEKRRWRRYGRSPFDVSRVQAFHSVRSRERAASTYRQALTILMSQCDFKTLVIVRNRLSREAVLESVPAARPVLFRSRGRWGGR